MKATRWPATVVGLVCFLTSLTATPIVESGGVWLSVPTCAVGLPACGGSTTRAPWDNPSQDDGLLPLVPGQPRGLGAILNNSSPYGTPSSPLPTFTNAQWYGDDSGLSLVQDLFFTGLQTYNITLLVRDTGNDLVLGWYGLDSQGNIADGGILIDLNVGVRNSVLFTPTTAAFGFFIKYGRPADCASNDWRAVCDGTVLQHVGGSGVPLDIFYSQTVRNSSKSNPSPGAPGKEEYEKDYDPNRQHFVALRTDQGMLLAVEDSWTSLESVTRLNTRFNGPVYESLGDFNDVVLQFNAVPEPSTFALLGLGVAGLIAFGRRRRSSK